MSKPTRKIYTKLVYDMKTGRMIESKSFDYAGPMALCEGAGDGDGDGDGGGAPEWVESLPQDVRSWDEVKNSDSPEKFWDQMVNMRSRMGSSIRIPGADAGEDDLKAFHEKIKEKVPGLMNTPNIEDPETLNDFFDRLGRPAEAKDYKVPEFKDSMDKPITNINKDVIEAFQKKAHEQGLSQRQFEEAVTAFIQPGITRLEQTKEKITAERKALADEWGSAYDRNTKVVDTFLKHTDAPETVLKTIESGGMDKASMVWFHNLATQAMGSKGNFQDDSNHRGVMTPDEAALKISEIRNNKKHPYYNKQDPGHKAAKKLMRELYLLKDPTNATKSAPGTGFPVGG